MANVCDMELKRKIEEWLSWDKNEQTAAEMQKLVDENKIEDLRKILFTRLSFGTAGLRGKMGVGYSRMNDLVIIQTGQGFMKYLERTHHQLLKDNGIVIGYDGRHNSRRWAELTATIFINAGYPVRLFSQVNPTPFVPFAVRRYSCASGVMVTASHNPKEDNGYKVYGPNSAQIVSPVDKEIQKSILENLKPLDSSWDVSALEKCKLLSDPLCDIMDSYLNIINNTIIPEHKNINEKQELLFTYTAMHGVGYLYFKNVCDVIKVKMVPVEEQKDPHPDFPTVKFPNPEEGKSSLDLAIRTARQNNSPVILANDPDADRLAVAELRKGSCDYKVFTGNELGALLGWWMLFCHKSKNPTADLSNVYMISSTVSSMILRTVAEAEGFNFVDTLTGFKWIGNKALDLEKEGKQVIFGYEEAIGFMCGSEVVDKDGISAAFQIATMASYLYSHNMTLEEKLEEIYNTYGYHLTKNSYYICEDPVKIKQIFDKIRNKGGKQQYPSGIMNNKYKIVSVRDLTTGYDSSQPDKKAILPVSSDSQMITFQFHNGLVCTLRTSGTEPKIKYYTELCASPDIKDKEELRNILNEMVEAVCEEMFEPNVNGLIPQSD